MYTRTRRATYPQLQPPQQGGMMGFLQQAQDQYNAANKANEDRYQDILGRLEGRYDRNMERVGNWGQTAMADSRDRAAENMGAIQANLSARGLGNSSIVESYRQRNAADLDRNLGQISEMRDSRMAQYDQTLSKDIADFMERRYDNAPNIGQIAQLAQLYGAGGGSNIGYFGGGERTSGSGRGSRRAISNPAGRRQGSRPFNRDEAARQYERDVKQYLQQMLRTGSANMAGQPLPWGPNGTSYSDRRGLTFRYGQSPNDQQVKEWIDRHGGNPYSTRPNDRREFMAGGVSPMAAMQMAAGMQGMMAPLQNAAFNIYNAGFNGYNPNTYGGYQPRYAGSAEPEGSEADQALTPVQERVAREQAEKAARIQGRRDQQARDQRNAANQAEKDAQLQEAILEEQAYQESIARANRQLGGMDQWSSGDGASDVYGFLPPDINVPQAQQWPDGTPVPPAAPVQPQPPQERPLSRAEVVARNNAEAARRREEFLRNASTPGELAIKRGMAQTDFANNNVAPQSAWEAGYDSFMGNARWGRDNFAPGSSARPFVEGDWDNSDLLWLGLDAAGTAAGGAALNKLGKAAGKYVAPLADKAQDAWRTVSNSPAWDKVNKAGEYLIRPGHKPPIDSGVEAGMTAADNMRLRDKLHQMEAAAREAKQQGLSAAKQRALQEEIDAAQRLYESGVSRQFREEAASGKWHRSRAEAYRQQRGARKDYLQESKQSRTFDADSYAGKPDHVISTRVPNTGFSQNDIESMLDEQWLFDDIGGGGYNLADSFSVSGRNYLPPTPEAVSGPFWQSGWIGVPDLPSPAEIRLRELLGFRNQSSYYAPPPRR